MFTARIAPPRTSSSPPGPSPLPGTLFLLELLLHLFYYGVRSLVLVFCFGSDQFDVSCFTFRASVLLNRAFV